MNTSRKRAPKGQHAWWQRVFLDHDHQWELVEKNEELEAFTYVCYCGISYLHIPGQITHYAPTGRVVRRLYTRG